MLEDLDLEMYRVLCTAFRPTFCFYILKYHNCRIETIHFFANSSILSAISQNIGPFSLGRVANCFFLKYEEDICY